MSSSIFHFNYEHSKVCFTLYNYYEVGTSYDEGILFTNSLFFFRGILIVDFILIYDLLAFAVRQKKTHVKPQHMFM